MAKPIYHFLTLYISFANLKNFGFLRLHQHSRYHHPIQYVYFVLLYTHGCLRLINVIQIEFATFLDFMKLKPLIKSGEVSAFYDHYSADIAGSNPLMEEDESVVADSPGDNLLAEFTSAVVQHSEPLETQELLEAKNAKLRKIAQ